MTTAPHSHTAEADTYLVSWRGEWPERERVYHFETFLKQPLARQWCRNHDWLKELEIRHPDGFREPYVKEISDDLRP
jgi:hypothetical protein